MSELGSAFVDALASKDRARLREVLHPKVDFRGLTPNRNWEATSSDSVIDEILAVWFGDSDQIEETLKLDGDAFADRERVGYRLRVRNPDGLFTVEQQAYIAERDGRIGWMRVVCSGFRPADGE